MSAYQYHLPGLRVGSGASSRRYQEGGGEHDRVSPCGNVTAAPDPWMLVVSAGRKERAGAGERQERGEGVETHITNILS